MFFLSSNLYTKDAIEDGTKNRKDYMYYYITAVTYNFSEPQNPRFVIESSFKSRAGYNGARMVDNF